MPRGDINAEIFEDLQGSEISNFHFANAEIQILEAGFLPFGILINGIVVEEFCQKRQGLGIDGPQPPVCFQLLQNGEPWIDRKVLHILFDGVTGLAIVRAQEQF